MARSPRAKCTDCGNKRVLDTDTRLCGECLEDSMWYNAHVQDQMHEDEPTEGCPYCREESPEPSWYGDDPTVDAPETEDEARVQMWHEGESTVAYTHYKADRTGRLISLREKWLTLEDAEDGKRRHRRIAHCSLVN